MLINLSLAAIFTVGVAAGRCWKWADDKALREVAELRLRQNRILREDLAAARSGQMISDAECVRLRRELAAYSGPLSDVELHAWMDGR